MNGNAVSKRLTVIECGEIVLLKSLFIYQIFYVSYGQILYILFMYLLYIMTKQVIYFLIFLNFLKICIFPPQEETVNARTKRMVKAMSLKKTASQILLIFSDIP